MTEKEIESELKRLRTKFAALKMIAQQRAELVRFLEFNEKNLQHVFANIGPTKAVFRAANAELQTWVRALFQGAEKTNALAQLARLDDEGKNTSETRR